MIISEPEKIHKFELDYDFTSREIALLAKFLRNNQDSIPEGLDKFYNAVESAIYNVLTLEEAGKFYS